MVAAQTRLEVGEFIHTIGDAHIYNNHVDQIKEQLSKPTHKLPTLKLNPDVKSIFDYEMSDIKLENYIHEDVIKAPIAVWYNDLRKLFSAVCEHSSVVERHLPKVEVTGPIPAVRLSLMSYT